MRFRLFGTAALSALAGCGGGESRPNIVLVSIDTLRADHLGCYGYARDTSPRLDRLAGRSIRYEHCFAPAPWTLPSHAAMLTGRHPQEIGIVDMESSIPEDVPLLAEVLSAAGYRTAGLVDSGDGGFVGARRGFARGFDRYDHAPHGSSAYLYDMADTVDAGLSWIDAETDEPFFLFLHTKSVHTAPADAEMLARDDAPYGKPKRYRTRFLEDGRERFDWVTAEGRGGVLYLRALNMAIAAGHFDDATWPAGKTEELVALYDGGIYYVDEQIGRLLDGLRERGLEGETLVVVTADHGEAFRDYEMFLHKEVYAPLLHVPLITHDPRDAGDGQVVSQRVSLADIVPWVLDRAGIAIPRDVTGTPLPANGDGPGDLRPFYSYFHFKADYFYEASALHEGPWKVIQHKFEREDDYRVELYDTSTDPDERRPIDDPERQERMLERLLDWNARGSSAEAIELDETDLERLRALGYVK